MVSNRCRFFAFDLLVLTALCCWLGSGDSALFAADSAPQTKPDVATLIEQLGADSYVTRSRAKQALQRVGLEAFDQLHQAQFHPDSEIAMSARFLISSLLVSWSKESDPPEVRDTLLEYGACSESERSSRIDRLAEFPNRNGLPALVRVACYERSLRLGRRAALALMQQPMQKDAELRELNSERILEILGDNDRQASEWLRAYAADLASGEYSSDRWRELISQQRLAIDTAATQQASRASVLDLVRVCATRAAFAGKTDEAIRLAGEHIDLIPPSTRSLVEACSWAIDNGLHPFVLELRGEHERMFNQQPILLYGAAEALKMASQEEESDRLAIKASQINPLPSNAEEKAAMQPKQLEETAKAHREIGNKLAERGLFHWAEREFRLIIDSLDLDSQPAAWARADLAQMLGELRQHRKVVDVLRPLIDRLEKDAQLKRQLIAMTMFSYAQILSSADFHEALAMIEEGNADDANEIKAKLVRAFQVYPTNVDILISMYRLEGDQEWREFVLRTLQQTIRQVEKSIQDLRDESRRFGKQDDIILGYQLNQYAWLVSNTEGDFRKALNYSLESLEIEADEAKLDTCARCYFANNDLENAIRMQKRALKLMPHSPPLRRQLELFESTRQTQQKDKSATAP